MNRVTGSNKKRYISPQLRAYRSLKDITAADTCICTEVKCPVYCQQYAYPMGGYGGVYNKWGTSTVDCPRYS